MNPTDDVAGPAFVPCTNLRRAVELTKEAYGRAVHGWETATLVDDVLHRSGFAVMDPFELEETCERFDVIAVVDVGEEHPVPVAIKALRGDDGKLVWWTDYVAPTPRHREFSCSEATRGSGTSST